MKVKNVGGKDSTKLKVRIDGKDCWSLDHTLAQIIVPALKRLKRDAHGYPATMPSFIEYDALPFDKRDTPKAKKLRKRGAEEWDAILDEMTWAFQAVLDDDRHLLSSTPEAYNEIQDRIKAGLHLFAEHYLSLWD